MLTNIKSESNAPFLKSPPLVHKIIFFEKKSTSSSKIGFSIEYSCHTRLTCAWQYFGTLIFELFFEIIRSSVDKINFLFLC